MVWNGYGRLADRLAERFFNCWGAFGWFLGAIASTLGGYCLYMAPLLSGRDHFWYVWQTGSVAGELEMTGLHLRLVISCRRDVFLAAGFNLGAFQECLDGSPGFLESQWGHIGRHRATSEPQGIMFAACSLHFGKASKLPQSALRSLDVSFGASGIQNGSGKQQG